MRALQGVIVSLNRYCGWAWKIVAVCAMEMMLLGENEVPEMSPSRSARPEGPRYLDYLKTNSISVDQVCFQDLFPSWVSMVVYDRAMMMDCHGANEGQLTTAYDSGQKRN